MRRLLLLLIPVIVSGCVYLSVEDQKRGVSMTFCSPAYPWHDSKGMVGRLHVVAEGTNNFTLNVLDAGRSTHIGTNAVAAIQAASEGFGRGLAQGIAGAAAP